MKRHYNFEAAKFLDKEITLRKLNNNVDTFCVWFTYVHKLRIDDVGVHLNVTVVVAVIRYIVDVSVLVTA